MKTIDKSKFIFAAIFALFLGACTTAQLATAQATATDALNAGAVIAQAYVGTTVPASALKTGNSTVDKYIATTTTVLTSPVTQSLVNDLFALAAKAPATVPAP